MNKKKFIAQQGSNTTVKLFDAETGQLYRVVTVGGNIVSSPYVSGDTLTVTVETDGKKFIKSFSLPYGSLRSSVAI